MSASFWSFKSLGNKIELWLPGVTLDNDTQRNPIQMDEIQRGRSHGYKQEATYFCFWRFLIEDQASSCVCLLGIEIMQLQKCRRFKLNSPWFCPRALYWLSHAIATSFRDGVLHSLGLTGTKKQRLYSSHQCGSLLLTAETTGGRHSATWSIAAKPFSNVGCSGSDLGASPTSSPKKAERSKLSWNCFCCSQVP